MSFSTQHIIRHLFQVESLEEVSRQQLEELVETYPSFGVGRYLLSRKLQAEKADHFGEETQKTNLYFTNPFWLQWLLQEDLGQPPADIPPVHERGIPAEEVFAPTVDTTEPTIDSEVSPSSEPDEVGESILTECLPPSALSSSLPPSAADELLKSIAELRDRRQADTAQTPSIPGEESPSIGIAGLALEQVEEQTPVEEQTSLEHIPTEEEPSSASEAAPSSAHEPAPELSLLSPSESTLSSTREPSPEPSLPPAREPESSLPPTPEPQPSPEPIFEPYHTVDYFASQGIRLVLDENPSDRLGKQLKSFTDWLKVMRKLPQKNREIVPDIAAELQVQAIAAHSIERRDIITEAMAEVLAKQGMREKATEMYRKLSLLEPEKSAYFAEKIEQLKII